MSLNDFEIIEKLGEGAYSIVYKVHRLKDNNTYALKKVKINNLNHKQIENALNQVRILASITHPNIIAYKQAFLQQSSSFLWFPFPNSIVMQYADNGDVFQKINKAKKLKKSIPESQIWSILTQVIKGLKQLHQLQILHRDLKSANVFLTKEGKVKLGDMNVSKIAKQGFLFTQTGTPYYASPQVWKEIPYDHKSDIWSLGCVIYQMAVLKPPFRGQDMQSLFKKIIKGKYPKISSQYSKELSQLIGMMMQVNPNNRPSCGTEQQADKLLELQCIKAFDNLNNQQGESSSILMNTIKIPKNLYYLTDKLPNPNYSGIRQKRQNNFSIVQTSQSTENNVNRKLPMLDSKEKTNQQELFSKIAPKKSTRGSSEISMTKILHKKTNRVQDYMSDLRQKKKQIMEAYRARHMRGENVNEFMIEGSKLLNQQLRQKKKSRLPIIK